MYWVDGWSWKNCCAWRKQARVSGRNLKGQQLWSYCWLFPMWWDYRLPDRWPSGKSSQRTARLCFLHQQIPFTVYIYKRIGEKWGRTGERESVVCLMSFTSCTWKWNWQVGLLWWGSTVIYKDVTYSTNLWLRGD